MKLGENSTPIEMSGLIVSFSGRTLQIVHLRAMGEDIFSIQPIWLKTRAGCIEVTKGEPAAIVQPPICMVT
jgi:hypothetical protein